MVVAVKLVGASEDLARLGATLRVCNRATNRASRVARERGVYRAYDLHKVTYGQVKEAVGAAQPSVRVIGKVCDAYQTHWANLKAGNYGKRGSQRHAKARLKVIEFRDLSAQPFDDRVLSWKLDDQQVSIWVTDAGKGRPGRIKLGFRCAPHQLEDLRRYRKGQSDLVYRRGHFYLHATIEVPDPKPTKPNGFIGVDLGGAQIAATATNTGEPVQSWQGHTLQGRRENNRLLRARLQSKGTKSAKRLLKHRSGKESRFATDVNHQISKRIVEEAKRTGRGIALENLVGIRNRVRHRKPQRSTFHSWSFAQLAAFIQYKAKQAGVVVEIVDPAYTSQQCSRCKVIKKSNRKNQATYHCSECDLVINADLNAAINIASKAQNQHAAAINQPNAAKTYANQRTVMSRKPAPSGAGS